MGVIHSFVAFVAQYPHDQKLLMQWDETSKSSPLDLISMNKNRVHTTT